MIPELRPEAHKVQHADLGSDFRPIWPYQYMWGPYPKSQEADKLGNL